MTQLFLEPNSALHHWVSPPSPSIRHFITHSTTQTNTTDGHQSHSDLISAETTGVWMTQLPFVSSSTQRASAAPFDDHFRLADSSLTALSSGHAQPMSMNEFATLQSANNKRARLQHRRTPSESTVASNSPASPYSASAHTPYTHVAGSDVSPNSPFQFADQSLLGKTYPAGDTAPYIPSLAVHAPGVPLAMHGYNLAGTTDDIPDFVQSSRYSMSSHGNNSPTTPHSGGGYGDSIDLKGTPAFHNDYRPNQTKIAFNRTDSQAYQDELYNPATTYTSIPAPAKRRPNEYLSPHRNLVNERLQNANLARSTSPASAVSREMSPFRDNSEYASARSWRNQGAQVGTAAGMRRQQEEEAARVEFAQHVPLRREPTKTISPKDAVLAYNDTEQPSLFQETIPNGYKQHTGGVPSWPTEYVPPPGATFGNLSAAGGHPQMASLRAAPNDSFAATNFNFMPLPPETTSQGQMQNVPYPHNNYSIPRMPFADATPEFPATLMTMESSLSDNNGPALSSQESGGNVTMPQRPTDTRANTGSYPCPYRGCTQRFGTILDVQRHKHESHRSQQPQHQQHYQEQSQQSEDDAGNGTGSGSPPSSASPTSSSGELTPSALAARNSQAGPHKCTRINPTTGKPCNTIFSRPYDLTRHEDTIHSNRKQKVRCPMCREEKTFSRSDALTRHMRVVHPEAETYGKRGRRDS